MNFGYSVSGFHCVALTAWNAGHLKQLAWGLRALTNGGIDLPVRLLVVGELNSS